MNTRSFTEVEHDLHKAHRHNYLYHTFTTVVGVQSTKMMDTLRQAGATDAEYAAIRAILTALDRTAWEISNAHAVDVQPLCDELGLAYDAERRASRLATIEVSHA